MTAFLCAPFVDFGLMIAAYLVVLWVVAKVLIDRCLAQIGKPFNRFAFWFTFFGWNSKDLSPTAIEKNYLPVWGMSDVEFQTVVAYRRMYQPFFWIITCVLLVFVAGPSNSWCR